MPIVFDGNGNILSGSDAAISIADDGLVSFIQGIKIAASKGIDFSAYGAGASIGSNLLDDYEEGTWTPDYLLGGSGSVTLDDNDTFGDYVKIGRLVVATFRITTSAVSTPSGDVEISGLPFAASNRGGAAIGVARDFNTDMPNFRLNVQNTESVIVLMKNATNGSFSRVQGGDLIDGADKNNVLGTLTYVTS